MSGFILRIYYYRKGIITTDDTGDSLFSKGGQTIGHIPGESFEIPRGSQRRKKQTPFTL